MGGGKVGENGGFPWQFLSDVPELGQKCFSQLYFKAILQTKPRNHALVYFPIVKILSYVV